MQHGLFGHPTSLASRGALKCWNAAQLGFLAHATVTPEHPGAVRTRALDFALGHAVRGMFCLLLGRREMIEPAQQTGAWRNTTIKAPTR